MKTAVLYDIHGNLPALEAVLAEVEGEKAEQVVVGGDVLPGPFPAEALDRLLSLRVPVHFIRGNGDRAVLRHLEGLDLGEVPEAFRPSVVWNAEQLTPRHMEEIASWTPTLTIGVEPIGRVHFCHATPRNDTEIFTVDTPESALFHVFDGTEADLVVCGHTHMQFDRHVGPLRVVNAGSVGMPHGAPGAYWLLLDRIPLLRKTAYDSQAAAAKILVSGSPVADAVAKALLHPLPEAEARERFNRAALQ